MEPLRGALIGAGYFAGFQAEAWKRIDGVSIEAVADSNPDRARDFAAKWGIPHAYGSAAELLDREPLDFVDIATRPETHVDLVTQATRKSVHVLCQKPMAPTWEECLRLVSLGREAGVRLLIHENWRWQPWYREMRRLLDSGALGRAHHLGFRMRTGDGAGPEPYPLQPYFREMPRLLVYETVVHFLDTFRFLGGEIRSVYCQMKKVNPVIRGEDYVLALVSFEGGAHGVIDASRTSGPTPAPLTLGTFTLEGDRARLRLEEDGRMFVRELLKPERPHGWTASREGYKGDSVRATQEHLLGCLRTGTRCESEGEEYLKTVAAVEACYRSAEAGRPVRLDEFRP